ncbi:MAG TPA: YsnF/AvaK domain-containing protein [Terriglobales bacterium]
MALGNPLRNNEGVGDRAVAALFHDSNQAENAIQQLTEAGVPKSSIGVAVCGNEKLGKKHGGFMQKLENLFSSDERQEYESDDPSDVLSNMGLNDQQISYYNHRINDGDVLVSVEGPYAAQARQVFSGSGAILPDQLTDEHYSSVRTQATGGGADLREANVGANAENLERQRIQLLGERLRIQKERIRTGEARIRKEVVTERQQVEVPVTREELYIERHPVEGERVAERAEFNSNQEVRIPLEEERVRVERQPVVREEVEVGKRAIQENRAVNEEVRHEELRVDDNARRGVASERDVNRSDLDQDINDPLRKRSA